MDSSRAFRKHKQEKQQQPSVQRVSHLASPSPFWRRLVILLAVVLTALGTWALFEFVIWSKLPPELVGKWEVTEGPQRGAIFDFSRRGYLEAQLHNPRTDNRDVMQASVAVEGKKLLVTTQNPQTRQYDTRACNITELTATTLIVEFEKGEVYKMARMK